MRKCVLQCCLTLLGLSLVLSRNGASSQSDLDLNLQQRRLLQRARILSLIPQDWNKNELDDLLSRLTVPDSAFPQQEISSQGVKQDFTLDLERSAEDPDNLPPRERKAGCKNFYWKGFTSC